MQMIEHNQKSRLKRGRERTQKNKKQKERTLIQGMDRRWILPQVT